MAIVYKQSDLKIEETKTYNINELDEIKSVINNLKFFFIEKWKIASDKQGSGNTANIGGIAKYESGLLNGNGIFQSEKEFDDYWLNYKKITITDDKGNDKKISTLKEFRKYKNNIFFKKPLDNYFFTFLYHFVVILIANIVNLRNIVCFGFLFNYKKLIQVS